MLSIISYSVAVLTTIQQKQEMSLKKSNGVGLKKEENITQGYISTCL